MKSRAPCNENIQLLKKKLKYFRKTHVNAHIFIFKGNYYIPLSIICAIFDVFGNEQTTFSQAERVNTWDFFTET